MAPIQFFRGRYGFLSNFAESTVEFEGCTYPTVEHAFQAAKTLDLSGRQEIAALATAAAAKKAGRRVALRSDWGQVKIDVMRQLLFKKFASGSEFAAQLLATGDAELIERTDAWNDKFWGVVKDEGQNWLGRLLMEVRSVLRT